jgi:peptidoglycan/LPS O-acetylase OafA/YrhL
VTALILSAQLARSPRLVRLGSYLAKRTLPIYLIHPILLAVLVAFLGSHVPNITVLSLVIVPVLVIAFTWLSVRTYDTLSGRTPWLFSFPRRRARIEPPTRLDEAAAATTHQA